jgi:gliding motility-associated-like protein
MPTIGSPLKDDSIYVYYRAHKGNLSAAAPVPAVFQWDSLRLTQDSLEFVPFKTEVNVQQSICSELKSGYYRVRIQSVDSQDTLGAWICQDTFQFLGINILNNNCENLQLKPVTSPVADGYSRYYYFDLGLFPVPFKNYIPRSNVPYLLRARWTTSKTIRPNISQADDSWMNQISPYIASPAPLVSSKYTVCITNIFGDTLIRSTDEIPAKASYANFQITSDQLLTPQNDTLRGEAPLPLSFNASISQNVETYNWKGYKEMSSRRIGAILPDIYWEESGSQTVNRIDNQSYTITDRFPIQLKVSNSYGCADSLIKWVRVDSSFFDKDLIPNLFSPNSDGSNDVFKLKADENGKLRSIRKIEISIYNRNGEKVFSSNKLDFAWDGKASGTNYECPTGVYFWVIKATGYDEKRYKGKEYRGLLHLFK